MSEISDEAAKRGYDKGRKRMTGGSPGKRFQRG